MLSIILPARRLFDERTETFIQCAPVTLKLEHSLISIQKWESKWHKSYLHSKDKTTEEQMDYIRCMSLDPHLDESVLMRLTNADIQKIAEYINDPMTGTTFSNRKDSHKRQIVTAEIIYYWMISFGIPFECAKWHLNQLMTLIEVCGVKNNPQKMNKRDAGRMRAAMNKSRRAQMGSRG